jgi:hypothetical protein
MHKRKKRLLEPKKKDDLAASQSKAEIMEKRAAAEAVEATQKKTNERAAVGEEQQIILKPSPKKKPKISLGEPISTYCCHNHNHPEKHCSHDCLRLETALNFYGITGTTDHFGEPAICGNQSSSCQLPNKESWKASFSKKKPCLYVCKHCIAIAHVYDEYTPPFFLCSACYDDINKGNHPRLSRMNNTRGATRRRRTVHK